MSFLVIALVALVSALWGVAAREMRWSWYVLTISAWIMAGSVWTIVAVASGDGAHPVGLAVGALYAGSVAALWLGLGSLFKSLTVLLSAPIAIVLFTVGALS